MFLNSSFQLVQSNAFKRGTVRLLCIPQPEKCVGLYAAQQIRRGRPRMAGKLAPEVEASVLARERPKPNSPKPKTRRRRFERILNRSSVFRLTLFRRKRKNVCGLCAVRSEVDSASVRPDQLDQRTGWKHSSCPAPSAVKGTSPRPSPQRGEGENFAPSVPFRGKKELCLFLDRGLRQVEGVLQADIKRAAANQNLEITACENPAGFRRVVIREGARVERDGDGLGFARFQGNLC